MFEAQKYVSNFK